jgi:hypothetical protein
VGYSDWINDGRITVCGGDSELVILTKFSVKGPFTLNIFMAGAGCFDCFYHAGQITGTQRLYGDDVCALFRSKSLVIKTTKKVNP